MTKSQLFMRLNTLTKKNIHIRKYTKKKKKKSIIKVPTTFLVLLRFSYFQFGPCTFNCGNLFHQLLSMAIRMR